MNRVTITAITAILLGTAAQLPGGTVTPCGPGADWVDTCTAGTYTFDSWTSSGSLNGGPPVTLNGTAEIHVGAPTAGHFDTELVSLNLTDGSGTQLSLSGQPSLGGVTQQSDTFHADSFFDVFFELTTPGGTLHNTDPAHLTDVVTDFPDATGTELLTNPISLYLPGGGAPVAQLTFAAESSGPAATFVADTPEPATLLLAGFGAAAILISRRRRA